MKIGRGQGYLFNGLSDISLNIRGAFVQKHRKKNKQAIDEAISAYREECNDLVSKHNKRWNLKMNQVKKTATSTI
jgi:hypothetical protein